MNVKSIYKHRCNQLRVSQQELTAWSPVFNNKVDVIGCRYSLVNGHHAPVGLPLFSLKSSCRFALKVIRNKK